ncbi:hypothetical protein Syun_009828 [Stephania yunnanensis]|uniref:Uncharacterized protein n=1 Tax=Stephania yunnanensis TaxID=152371 RepID=A0AAP0KH63_9MAGN
MLALCSLLRSPLSARRGCSLPLSPLSDLRFPALFLSPLSLTEISLPNPKSLSSLQLRLRRYCRLCRRRMPKIGASEALSHGVLTVLTTGLSDEEIYQYCLNLKEHVTPEGQRGYLQGLSMAKNLDANLKNSYKQCQSCFSNSSLASIDWKSLGLNVKSSAIDEDGDAVLE